MAGEFELHSGARSSFLIDCGVLTDTDLAALALVALDLVSPYGDVVGVPTGGLRFAEAMRRYQTVGPTLVVDDVLTTGASITRVAQDVRNSFGLVIFARGVVPPWVTALFTMATP